MKNLPKSSHVHRVLNDPKAAPELKQRFLERLRASGALGGITQSTRDDVIDNLKKSAHSERGSENGFNAVYHLGTRDPYKGGADYVILVWNDNQIIPADTYREAWYPNQKVDIAVCEDPNVQKAGLGDKGVIYAYA